MVEYDVVIIGAGSLGVPAAYSINKAGYKVAVIDKNASAGQGDNKHAIGGVRATHTDKSKIITSLRSIKTFSTWEEKYGDDIEWQEGGYVFVAYTDEHEKLFKQNIVIQKSYGLKIDFVKSDVIKELVPGIIEDELRGGTYSPHDGNLSPLKAISYMYLQAKNQGVDFFFKEKVVNIFHNGKQVNSVKTDHTTYSTDWVVNAAGAEAAEVAKMVGDEDLPIIPDSHGAAISEPVKRFFDPMVVDLRPGPKSQNYYFYQNVEGKIIMCYTPNPLIQGTDRRETSDFLPEMSLRLCHLIPRMKNLRIRRVWRGLYPMTPDGSPIVDYSKGIKGYINLAGTCGQGLMLGPGLGELTSHLISGKLTSEDKEILTGFSRYRDFSKEEELK